MLEDKIKKLGSRYIQNGIFNDYKFVKVYIPLEWDLIGTDDKILVERDENTPTITVFATEDDNFGFSDIIDSILSLIQYNNDKILKEKLLNELTIKLEVIFSENDLETLKTLTFEFNGKTKRPYNRRESINIEEPTKKETKKIEKRDLLVENVELTNSEIDLSTIVLKEEK